MTSYSKLAAAGAALAISLAATAASAAIVTATYTGTISATGPLGDTDGAFDTTGEFGGGANLDGLGFTAVFTFDTSQGVVAGVPPIFEQFSGPYQSATLTIGSATRAFLSTTLGTAFVATDFVDTAYLNLVRETTGSVDNFLLGFLYNPALPTSLTGPFSNPYGYSLQGPLDYDHRNQGEFLLSELDLGGAPDPDTGVLPFLHHAHGYLVADSLTLTASSAPEPATWALMLLGFGGLGAMARRSRRRTVLAQ